MKNFYILLFNIFTLLSISCGGGGRASIVSTDTMIGFNEKSKGVSTNPQDERARNIKIEYTTQSSFKQGDSIQISYTVSQQVDSIKLFIRGQEIKEKDVNGKWSIPTDNNSRVGVSNFKITAYESGFSVSKTGSFIIYSTQEVKNYKARAFKIYPHDKNSYTQGLEFHDGMLYESSGEYGKSYVRALEFPSMKVKQHKNLDSKLFAEGLTFIADKMYLLTWQEYKCLILDPKTLKQTAELQYNTEGWGITTDKNLLYMTDGTQYIYIIDPTTFNQIDRLEIMLGDNAIKELNELEWIEGEIWANVFTTDQILRINPKSGAVVGVIDASGLLLKSDYNANTNVLNGIAYDNQSKKIYLTGKNWPKLFEVIVKEE